MRQIMMAAILAAAALAPMEAARGAALPPADGSAFLKEWMRPQSQPAPTPRPSPQTGAQPSRPSPQAGAQPPRAADPSSPANCAATLRNGCEAQQSACRMACPPMWSTNPGAPAFTPTDRAGCTQQCFTRYLACLNLYGCR
ncbi:hypothetical protein [Muricoccus aerilatus]|uniref:hypothetical protein n=1 Tax=Muricoccus aerilatus TaxID=452982 RepID=UPI0005C1FE8D|nr:hypothetical protein [Roseomonas aerilata]